MSREAPVRTYLAAQAAADLDTVLQCFTEDGKVSSPVYGGVPVADFYRRLFADTAHASVAIHTLFTAERKIAAHFAYHWEMKSGARTTTDLVDIFDFAPGSDRITHLQIIFDTAKIGKA
ncbi:nuclear transport factor 2 family protein [Polymorphobacter sp.]|uniref:nuclear transport factor 2 family protein n=1 Tax=Polymorphobacter sp. TaxID=1909290 RepID=UPI003F6F727F